MSVLQSRHELNITNRKNSLEAALKKFFLNGQFGYSMLEVPKFSKHSFAKESSIMGKERRKNIKSLSLVGVLKKRTHSELLYLVERSQKNASIQNLIQWGGFVLGHSRTIFYGILLTLLNCLDTKKAQLAYIDTGI
jgi:hypothetical protein